MWRRELNFVRRGHISSMKGALSLWRRGCSRYGGWSIFAVDPEGGRGGTVAVQEGVVVVEEGVPSLWRRGKFLFK